jgi:hypothetical protein
MDNKYGRVFTTSDVEKILEASTRKDAPDSWWTDHGDLDFDAMLADMDDMGVRFKFEPDEPLFILRGRDRRAEAAVRFYGAHQSPNAPANHLDAILKAVTAFSEYAATKPGQMKEPD